MTQTLRLLRRTIPASRERIGLRRGLFAPTTSCSAPRLLHSVSGETLKQVIHKTRLCRRRSSIGSRDYSAASSIKRAKANDNTVSDDSITPKKGSPSSHSAATTQIGENRRHQRIWLANNPTNDPIYWEDDIVNASQPNPDNLARLLERIEGQELDGARMRSKQYGVLHKDPAVDMRLLTANYTVNSLASALRDREDALQLFAQLAEEGHLEQLQSELANYHPNLVLQRRNQTRRLDVGKPLNVTDLETIRKALMRMPRSVTQAHGRRAGVVVPIVHVDGIPSLLLEKRARSLRAHPDEVCLPGGMVCSVADRTIVETCLREMKEEIPGLKFDYNRSEGGHGVSVLGVLRCNWGEVHHMVGVAVTPVVCCLGQDLAEVSLNPNADEVAEVFTIPLVSLLDKSQWVYKDDHAPIFVGGPYVIWGLTGYILERFWKDVLIPFHTDSRSITAKSDADKL